MLTSLGQMMQYLHAISNDAGHGRGEHVSDEEPREALADLVSFVPAGDCEEGGRDETSFTETTINQQQAGRIFPGMILPKQQSGRQEGAKSVLESLEGCDETPSSRQLL